VQQARAVYAPRPRSVGGRTSIEVSASLSSGRILASSREVIVAMIVFADTSTAKTVV
jgi:hypothetical protein